MSILTGPEIVRIVNRTKTLREAGQEPPVPLIDITPFDPQWAGPNSYDVHLSPNLLIYDCPTDRFAFLDMRKENPTLPLTIPEGGLILYPNVVYLGSTIERTVTAGLVPWLDGRSSIGRLGMAIHATAGRGDDGFGTGTPGGCAWTLEITVTHKLKVYPGARIGQLTFFSISGERQPYKGRYSKQSGPVASLFHASDDNK